MSLSKKQLAILALILANVIWGAALPIYKWALEIIPPFTFSFLRFFISVLILFPIVYKKIKIPFRDVPMLIFGSIISVTLQIPLLFFGLKLAPSINAPIIISSGPIILIAAAVIFLREKISKRVLIGTLVSLVGVLIIILKPALTGGFGGNVLGNFLIFLATICGVIQAITLKKLLVRNEPLIIIFLTFVIGSLTLLPEAYLEINKMGIFTLNFQAIAGIAYASILCSVIAYYLLAFGIKYIDISEIGIFSYVDPIATILVAIPLLNEKITETYMIATILVLGGIFIAEKRLNYHPIHKLLR